MGPPLPNGLTQRQNQVMIFIVEYHQIHKYAPTIRDIGSEFKIAPSSALDHLKALEKKGFIKRLPSRSRCLEIIRRDLTE